MSITPHKSSDYNKINSKMIRKSCNLYSKTIKNFKFCLVRTSTDKTYKCKIIKESRNSFEIQWFNCIKKVSSHIMSFGNNSIVGFCNE
ncbi:hypothetical protein CRU98_10095 [Arcobacter sp. CECT 8986]|uniref:hypothetical protein n=1 Tax=Arcobacter sp. CECT 8986 TaxID=2044507 RepID=UPI001009A99A|nr:hypothetical protein [Arcobacter sp. CECT 8986]RXJ98380.1 hypothetical protein CRU98_10095 [Arcobacter sp. CECT 8986]